MGTAKLSLARLLALKEMMYCKPLGPQCSPEGMPINNGVTLSVFFLNISSACGPVKPSISGQTVNIPSEGTAVLTPSSAAYQDATSDGKSVSTQAQETPVTTRTFFNKLLDHSQSQLAKTGREGIFYAVIHQKRKSQRSVGYSCFVLLFPGISSCHGSPSLKPSLWLQFLYSFFLEQNSSLRHPHVDTLSRTPWLLEAGRMSLALHNSRF